MHPQFRALPIVRKLNLELLAKKVTRKTEVLTTKDQIQQIIRNYKIYGAEEVNHWRENICKEADKRTQAGQTVNVNDIKVNYTRPETVKR